jgi:hypothetical protein
VVASVVGEPALRLFRVIAPFGFLILICFFRRACSGRSSALLRIVLRGVFGMSA